MSNPPTIDFHDGPDGTAHAGREADCPTCGRADLRLVEPASPPTYHSDRLGAVTIPED